MRKRTIISIIFSIAAIIATSRFWLNFSPMPVKMNIQGTDTIGLEVRLNKRNDSEFKKYKYAYKKIDLSKTNFVEFQVENSKFPKRLRLVFSSINNKTDIKISDIKISGKDVPLNNLKKYSAQDAKIKIQNNAIIIKPQNDTFNLDYNEPLHVRSAFKFNFELFVIVAFLSFLLAYKLCDYIADFKTVKGKSRADIIFLTIFFIFLFIPMSHINHAEISQQENRTLAKWEPIINKKY